MRLILAAFAGLALGACGARSELTAPEIESTDGGGGGGGEGPDPCPEASCSDLTRGVFPLLDANGAALGWLFMFDATGACNGAPTHYSLRLDRPDGLCLRSSDIVVTELGEDTLTAVATNHGGTASPECGGSPTGETATIRLARDGCDPSTYTLSVVNDKPGSPFTLEARAVRCRCELGWDACSGNVPDDWCAP